MCSYVLCLLFPRNACRDATRRAIAAQMQIAYRPVGYGTAELWGASFCSWALEPRGPVLLVPASPEERCICPSVDWPR